MRIAAIDIFPLRLPFREEFRIARGSVGNPTDGAPHLYVRIRTESGHEGWGEARPSHRWSYETEESVLASLRRYLAPALIGADVWELRELHERMDRELAPGISVGAPIAKCALDMAAHDLLACSAGVPLHRFLGGAAEEIRLSFLISVADPESAGERAAAAWGAGFRAMKVKIGSGLEHDLELLRAVRTAAPAAYLWADANQAYDSAGARLLARRMEPLAVDCLEQPIPANDWLGLARLTTQSPVPIGVDESVFSAGDLLQLIRLGAGEILVVKLSKMAGVGPALECIRLARTAGMRILGSGLTETRLGLAATAHVLAAGGGCDYADLNGPQFLAEDPVAGGVDVSGGAVRLSHSAGIGVVLDEEKLHRFSVS